MTASHTATDSSIPLKYLLGRCCQFQDSEQMVVALSLFVALWLSCGRSYQKELNKSLNSYQQSFFTGPASHYERLALAGTPYATIHPSLDEWNATMSFRSWEGQLPLPIHFFMHCLQEKKVQIYFVVEESFPLSWNREQPRWTTLQQRLHLLIDSVDTAFHLINGTTDNNHFVPQNVPLERSFQSIPVDISGKTNDASLLVQINEFCQYISFPLINCLGDTIISKRHGIRHHRSKNNQLTDQPLLVYKNQKRTNTSTSTYRMRQPLLLSKFQLPYVRPVDDGLLHASIQPSLEEWIMSMLPEKVVYQPNCYIRQ